jgi:hypothetical protein
MATSAGPWTAALVDGGCDIGRQTYTLTRVYRLTVRRAGHTSSRTVRIQVRRDSYRQQSHATAYVLTDALTWTALASTGTEAWFDATPSPYARDGKVDALWWVADALLERVRRILPVPDRPGP